MKNLKPLLVIVLLGSLACQVAAQTYVIKNAKIHTLDDLGTLEKASILIVDGEITAIGADVSVPQNATVIDGTGKVVTAGVFDSYSSLGLVEVGAEDSTVDSAQTYNYGPAFKVVDGFNPRAITIQTNRIEGITRALIVPDSSEAGQVLAGTASIVHFGSTERYVVRERAAVVAFLGETGAFLSGGSRASALLRLKEALSDADDYDNNRTDYNQGSTRDYVLGRADLEALQDVINGNIPLLVYANRVTDIEAALDLSEQYDIEVVISGGAEAWMLADKLADANVGVVINPMQNLPDSFESLNATYQNAIRLHKAGVVIAFSYGDSHNARNLTQAAGVAVANGLPWEAALRAITVNPMKLFGGGDTSCCALRPGATAELVVWDGDPLEVTTFADHVFIAGKKISMRSRQHMLRDRYMNLKDEKPFAYRK